MPGGTWFFTVNLLQRHGNRLLVREIDLLRVTVRNVRDRYPFHVDAWVVLPEHLHCVWTLPPGDRAVGWVEAIAETHPFGDSAISHDGFRYRSTHPTRAVMPQGAPTGPSESFLSINI
ncbi:MAG: hypothetical protein ACXWUF_21700 [Methylomagnum sp.]